LYPTMEENLFHLGIQQKKTCGVVGYNAEDFSVLYPLMQKNSILLCCIYYEENVIVGMVWDRARKNLLCCGIQYTP
jgi:hypothetical protein